MIITDPNLKPRLRFSEILNSKLEKEGFKFIKSKNNFKRKFKHGQQIISLNYISTLGVIHGVGIYGQVIFDAIEKKYKELFGTHWSNWTVHVNLGGINQYLCEFEERSNKTTYSYTDQSLNKVANIFLSKKYPEILNLFSKFDTVEKLYAAYSKNPANPVNFVPRIERRILLALLLTKQIAPNNYNETKEVMMNYLNEKNNTLNRNTYELILRGINTIDNCI